MLETTLLFMPVIIRDVVLAIVFAVVIAMCATGNFALAIKRAVFKPLPAWLLMILAVIAYPPLFLRFLVLEICLELLVIIEFIFNTMITNPESKLYGVCHKDQYRNETVNFWNEIFSENFYKFMIFIIFTTESNVFNMFVSMVILVGVTYGISKFSYGTLGRIDWENKITAEAAFGIVIVVLAFRVFKTFTFANSISALLIKVLFIFIAIGAANVVVKKGPVSNK